MSRRYSPDISRMKVRYTDTALAEISHILSYIAKDNPLAADEVGAIMRATINRLAEFPRLAIETDVPDVRVAPVLPYRYLIFYTVHDDLLVIRNVRTPRANGRLLGGQHNPMIFDDADYFALLFLRFRA